jgi:gluconate 2-dehydrogenase gamma chain
MISTRHPATTMGKHMNEPGDPNGPRRSFLLSSGGILTSAWIASQWPGISAAHDHAAHAASMPTPTGHEFFSATEAADVEAIAAQIVPSGATAGAREARVILFIDRSLATFFSDLAPSFREGLGAFQTAFRAAYPGTSSFAAASTEQQHAFLGTVDRTAFFDSVRMLTLLGMFTDPRYAGNYQQKGWKLIGFEDQHAFTPPFGHYDRDYAGFVPYPGFNPLPSEPQS